MRAGKAADPSRPNAARLAEREQYKNTDAQLLCRYSKNKEAAWLFMQYIASKGAMPAYAKAGGIPPRRTARRCGPAT
jgi:hypothetical protein